MSIPLDCDLKPASWTVQISAAEATQSPDWPSKLALDKWNRHLDHMVNTLGLVVTQVVATMERHDDSTLYLCHFDFMCSSQESAPTDGCIDSCFLDLE